MKGYWKLEEEVLGRTIWRIGFVRSYRSIVRQTRRFDDDDDDHHHHHYHHVVISFDDDRFSHIFFIIRYVLIIASFPSIVTGNYDDVK